MSDNVIVLSHDVNLDGSLPPQIAQRLQHGLDLYQQSADPGYLILSGGIPPTESQKDLPWSHAQAMYNRVSDELKATGNVLREEFSLDTVGQAIFSRRDIAIPLGLEDLTVVSHEYHIPRIQAYFELVYGDSLNLNYAGVDETKFPSQTIVPRTVAQEAASTDAFNTTFAGVTPGNMDEIFRALHEKHPWYKNRADFEK